MTPRLAERQDAEPVPEAETPELVKLRLVLGDETRRSAAQLYRYGAEELAPRRAV